jgi:multisubunit Na+/H+ antiporter MnhF subunit
MTATTTQPANALRTEPTDRLATLLRVAWMSILLGLGMQFVSMAAVRLAGGPAAELGAFLRDLTQKIAWSTLVCVGVALGSTVAAARPIALGLAGFLAAPIAFVAAKTVQKSTAQAVGVAPPEELGAWVFSIVLILRAVEYATLGATLAWLARRATSSFGTFVMSGFTAGLLFGGSVLSVLFFNSNPRMPTPRVISAAINELFFPVGCSLVLFAAKCLGERIRPDRGDDK